MAKLTTKERKKLPAKDFALGKGRYPIEDKAHARNALARAAQHASPAEKATIKRKVRAKYPDIGKHEHHAAIAEHPGPHEKRKKERR